MPTWLSRRKLGLPLSRGIIVSQLLQMRAQQHVQGIRNEAEREILANRDVVQERAQQWVNDSIRPLQQQIAIGSQQLVDRDNQLMG